MSPTGNIPEISTRLETYRGNLIRSCFVEISRPSIQTVRELIQMGDGRWALQNLISGDTSPNLWPLAEKTEYPELRVIPKTPNTRSQTKELVG